MAIDYKKEWEKLMKEHGEKGIVECKEHQEKGVVEFSVPRRLGTLMKSQIHNTIQKREKLMKHYLISGMKTDIIGASQYCHSVSIGFHNNVFGTVSISKKDFGAWCKKRRGGE